MAVKPYSPPYIIKEGNFQRRWPTVMIQVLVLVGKLSHNNTNNLQKLYSPRKKSFDEDYQSWPVMITCPADAKRALKSGF